VVEVSEEDGERTGQRGRGKDAAIDVSARRGDTKDRTIP
jgi:hypothetical protein